MMEMVYIMCARNILYSILFINQQQAVVSEKELLAFVKHLSNIFIPYAWQQSILTVASSLRRGNCVIVK